jgi:hypothetical protein
MKDVANAKDSPTREALAGRRLQVGLLTHRELLIEILPERERMVAGSTKDSPPYPERFFIASIRLPDEMPSLPNGPGGVTRWPEIQRVANDLATTLLACGVRIDSSTAPALTTYDAYADHLLDGIQIGTMSGVKPGLLMDVDLYRDVDKFVRFKQAGVFLETVMDLREIGRNVGVSSTETEDPFDELRGLATDLVLAGAPVFEHLKTRSRAQAVLTEFSRNRVASKDDVLIALDDAGRTLPDL